LICGLLARGLATPDSARIDIDGPIPPSGWRQTLRHFRVVKFIAAQPAPLKPIPEQDGVHLPGKFMDAPRPVSLDHFAGRIERQAV
jgi:hypothetical protein